LELDGKEGKKTKRRIPTSQYENQEIEKMSKKKERKREREKERKKMQKKERRASETFFLCFSFFLARMST